jgi:hypothetical protein
MTERGRTSGAGGPGSETAGRASGRRWAALGLVALALVAAMLLAQRPAPASGAEDPALRARLAAALVASGAGAAAGTNVRREGALGEPGAGWAPATTVGRDRDIAAAAAAAKNVRRDPGLAALRRAAKQLGARHRRDAAALAGAISQPGAAGSRALVQAASRLRADALDLAARAKRLHPRTKAGKRGRSAVLVTQAAAVRALDAIRAFGQSTETAAASGHLATAEAALAGAERLAAAAARRIGCAKPCGSGF